MHQIRVAMISYHTCPLATLGGKDTGGMNVYVRELTRHLGQLGVHVDVYTRSQDEHVPHVLHDLGYGNRVIHVPAGPEIPLSKQTLSNYIPQFANEISKIAESKKLQYDFIHSHYWMSGIAAKQLKQQWNVPIVHMFHTLGLMKNRIAQSQQEIEGDYRVCGEHEVIRSADKIIIATPAEKTQLEFLYKASPNKMKIIPPGVDLAHFYAISPDEAKEFIGVPPDDCMLLYVGRIEPLKGIDILIKALAYIRQKGVLDKCPHYLAIIGGEPHAPPQINDEMANLQMLCHQLGLDDVVVFLGKRDQSALPYYYSAAQVIILPSHYESFGMVALEAMACGTPVIASQVGGLAYLIEDGKTGFFIPDGDPEALGDKLIQIIQTPTLRQEMSKKARQKAQAYSWKNIASNILDVYQSMLPSTQTD